VINLWREVFGDTEDEFHESEPEEEIIESSIKILDGPYAKIDKTSF
jgi:hypothetical protein